MSLPEPPEDPLARVQRERQEEAEVLMTQRDLLHFRQEYEQRSHRRWLGQALRNLLLWVVAVTGALLTAWDVVIHIIGPKR